MTLTLGASILWAEVPPRDQTNFQKDLKEPLREEALYWTAEAHFKSKEYPTAVKFYTQLMQNYPHSRFFVYSKYSRGWAYQELGSYEEAIAEFEETATEFPEHPLWLPPLF